MHQFGGNERFLSLSVPRGELGLDCSDSADSRGKGQIFETRCEYQPNLSTRS